MMRMAIWVSNLMLSFAGLLAGGYGTAGSRLPVALVHGSSRPRFPATPQKHTHTTLASIFDVSALVRHLPSAPFKPQLSGNNSSPNVCDF
ncbi:uncharacterized protein MYCGRDRAFT_106576 [Zymoseptoria tritici IPO323]|uniref:Secreted protein n=1 Tax=Zymoseptoria tritici (strain CBS 115943 / IPO323) TaxID=336722 RepID=F9XQJ1_ZYMTI|nr:uncharacterized protein MYCGRDRAFT_106576 [Zymoseptoria tritici IPO323]EGP82370.1 hypothetical protein MYCGRDRAFT_106576 [Zymoseptoria tritici IPO323]